LIKKGKPICCVVPAAGIGQRMQSDIPKQYLPFADSTVLEQTLKRLLSSPLIKTVIVALHPEDQFWQKTKFFNHPQVLTVVGGKERADSVLNALNVIKQFNDPTEWVMVHDAARPCIDIKDIKKLLVSVFSQQVGAILAMPLHDTVKKVLDQQVVETLDRRFLWRALTPQVFKLNDLMEALLIAKENAYSVTDEASAIEKIAGQAMIVEGRADNIKITSPADLKLAEYFIQQQELN